MKSRHYLVSGRVQGVGFRNFVFKRASALGLTGQVRNLDDGRVEVLAQGSEETLAELERALAKGPMLAKVINVEATVLSDAATMQAKQNDSAGPGFTVTEDGAVPWSFER